MKKIKIDNTKPKDKFTEGLYAQAPPAVVVGNRPLWHKNPSKPDNKLFIDQNGQVHFVKKVEKMHENPEENDEDGKIIRETEEITTIDSEIIFAGRANIAGKSKEQIAELIESLQYYHDKM